MFNHIEGKAFDVGCQEERVGEMWLKAESITPDKKIRSVRDWQWWDIILTDEERKELFLQAGLSPAIIYSDYVINDSSEILDEGNFVRSTLLVNFYNDCIFETRNSFYILVGSGIRKDISMQLAFSVVS